MKKSLIRQLKSEDWVIVGAGAAILLLALLFPRWMPAMPKDLSSAGNWMSAGAMFLFLLVLTGVCQRILGRPLRRFAVSLLAIFGVALLSQAVASIPAIKRLGFEAVFFSVIFGLVISNFFRVPEWLKPAIQSEFYIKIGIVCLGATILFGEVLQSGVYALIQAFIVVFTVWYFAFWLARRMRVDEETSTMLASSVSICGVSAAIATCGVIRGDNKKLSYIISLVLVCAVPMMYLMPWLAGLLLPTVLSNPETVQEVAGAWMGGTIDTTGAVVASGALLGETAEQTAIIVKSSQNVLLGIAAFVISLYWSYKGQNKRQRTGDLGAFPEIRRGFRRRIAPLQPVLRRQRSRAGPHFGQDVQQYALQYRVRLHRPRNPFPGYFLEGKPPHVLGFHDGPDVQHRSHADRGLPAVRRTETLSELGSGNPKGTAIGTLLGVPISLPGYRLRRKK